MSLLLKITLSILTVLFINGFIGVSLWFGNLREYTHPLTYARGKYTLISILLMVIAICYIPFMFIWHLY